MAGGPWWHNSKLFPHQRQALDDIGRYWRAKTTRAALVRMPTGTGKTGVIASAALTLPEIRNALVVTPWDSLRRQMAEDLRRRFWEVVPFPAAQRDKDVFEFFPSDLKEQLTNGNRSKVFVGTIQALQWLQANDVGLYEELRANLDAVFVDEGHREPAPTWAKSVRDLGKATVLFTATPYRNDFKVFDVDPNFVTVLTHKEAVRKGYIRSVEFVERLFGGESPSAERFVDALLTFYRSKRSRLAGSKPKVIVRCQTAAAVTDITQRLLDAGERAVGIHDTFQHDGAKDFTDAVPDTKTSEKVFWVHQYKMMEGLDDADFSLLALFEPFDNGRSLVQQIGRVIRNPDCKKGQLAYVLADGATGQHAYWEGYLAYEAGFDPNVTEQRQVYDTLIRTQPEMIYIDGDYRSRFDLQELDPTSDLKLPLAAHVYNLPGAVSADKFLPLVREDLVRDDLDVLAEKVDGDVHVLVYLSCRNSPVLAAKALLEYALGYVVIRRVRDLLFYCDSRARRSEGLSSIGSPVEPAKLERVFDGAGARLTHVTLRNSDLGRHAVRRRSIQAFSIEETAPGLSDYSHFCSMVYGHVREGGKDGSRRYVGFSNARVSDPSPVEHSLDAWRDWTDGIATSLEASAAAAPRVFKRFAERVRPPAERDCEPQNILLDIQDVLEHFVDTSKPSRQVQLRDLCVPVEGSYFTLRVNDVDFRVRIKYEPARGRYELEAGDFGRAFIAIEQPNTYRRETLLAYINREQAFRIVPRASGIIYARRHFYRPRLPVSGSGAELDLSSVLVPTAQLDLIDTEKGEAGSAHARGWAANCVFGLIDGNAAGTEMERWLDSSDILVCDDLGTEAADFIIADTRNRRVAFVHAKAQRTKSLVSASKLAEVTSQAVKNLDFVNPFSSRRPPNVRRWDDPWNGGDIGTVTHRIRPRAGRRRRPDADEVWAEIQEIIRDPSSERQVWLVIARSLSVGELRRQAESVKPTPETIQVLYALQSTWSAVASVGAVLRVFASP